MTRFVDRFDIAGSASTPPTLPLSPRAGPTLGAREIRGDRPHRTVLPSPYHLQRLCQASPPDADVVRAVLAVPLLSEIAPVRVMPRGVEIRRRDPMAARDVLDLPPAPQDCGHIARLSLKITQGNRERLPSDASGPASSSVRPFCPASSPPCGEARREGRPRRVPCARATVRHWRRRATLPKRGSGTARRREHGSLGGPESPHPDRPCRRARESIRQRE